MLAYMIEQHEIDSLNGLIDQALNEKAFKRVRGEAGVKACALARSMFGRFNTLRQVPAASTAPHAVAAPTAPAAPFVAPPQAVRAIVPMPIVSAEWDPNDEGRVLESQYTGRCHVCRRTYSQGENIYVCGTVNQDGNPGRSYYAHVDCFERSRGLIP